MQEDDRFRVYQDVTAMFEAHSRPKPSPQALKLYWDALQDARPEDFDAAMTKASRELKFPAKPSELREFAREARHGGSNKPVVHRCHFHGDGRYERYEQPRPDQPSTNPTMWWCDRCTHFVKLGQQQPDPPRQGPTLRGTVVAIAREQERR